MSNGTVLSSDDAKKIAAELAKLSKGTTPGTATASLPSAAIFGKELADATDKLNPFKTGLNIVKGGVDLVSATFAKLEEVVQPNLAAFRELSKSGASFSNDIVGMVVAQKGMRLSSEEFVEVMKNNAANLTGLGGNVTRGAEAFARFSEEFLDSNFTDGLKQAGYTNKELNDVLGLQLSIQRYTFREDEASRKASIEAAGRLATEMDLQAKLTGKSREEQMATMRQVKEDAAIEAKFRMIGIEKGADAEKAAREEYASAFNKAVLTGTEKVFRESTLYGTTVSKEAAMQGMAAGQSANKAMIEAGRAFKDGEFERSKTLQEKAQSEIISYQKTAAFLQTTMIPSQNALVESQQKALKTNQGVYDALQKVGQMEEHKFKTDAEKLQIAKQLAAEAAAGQNEQGKEVSGATKAIINLGTRVEEVESTLYKKMVLPINEMVGPALGQLARDTLGRDTVRKDRSSSTFKQDVGEVIDRAREPRPAKPDAKLGFEDKITQTKSNIPGGEAITNASAVIFSGAEIFTKAVQNFNATQAEPKKRQTGSIGMTGNLFEDFGTGTTVQLHGKESVLTEKQLLDMAKGISANTMTQTSNAFKNISFSSSEKKPDINKTMSSINQDTSNVFQSMMAGITGNMQTLIKQNENVFQSMMPGITGNMQALSKETGNVFQSMMPGITGNMQAMVKENENVFQSMAKETVNTVKSVSKQPDITVSSTKSVDSTNKSNINNGINLNGLLQSIVGDVGLNKNLQSTVKVKDEVTSPFSTKSMMNSFQNIDIEKQFKSMSEKLTEVVDKTQTQTTIDSVKNEYQAEKPVNIGFTKDAKSNLDDVVGGLNSLNTKLDRLLDTQLDIGTQQIRATKSNNNNVYARA